MKDRYKYIVITKYEQGILALRDTIKEAEEYINGCVSDTAYPVERTDFEIKKIADGYFRAQSARIEKGTNIAIGNIKKHIRKTDDECGSMCKFLHTVNNAKFCLLTFEAVEISLRVQPGIIESYPHITETCEVLFEKKSHIKIN